MRSSANFLHWNWLRVVVSLIQDLWKNDNGISLAVLAVLSVPAISALLCIWLWLVHLICVLQYLIIAGMEVAVHIWYLQCFVNTIQ